MVPAIQTNQKKRARVANLGTGDFIRRFLESPSAASGFVPQMLGQHLNFRMSIN
jgi:hypothetical protein